ncbi:hypothetical protein IEQ34_002821 [Dendrobium chrysotoxum]|uniref:Ubiquitin-like protease family profile domain-containing protein n=1 Tax=Dendrobium chrysotoxum TaxID=161865 RepID=A0AAV7HIB3_DENCH|nr:hypothetical protein IEQ34_002821 [Dendrobium chrysotoxum]
MAGTPLKIDWSQMLPEKEASTPPLELEVEPTSPVPSSISVLESSSWPIEQKVTDGQIEEKILRLTMHLGSDIAKNLSDKGKKLQANLQAWQKELERRKLTRIKTIDEKCEAATESKAAEPIAPRNSLNAIATSECDPPSSFFSLFNQKLDERAGSASTSKISSANPCQINEGTNLCHMSSQATLPSTCMESSKEKKRHFNAICSSIQTSSFYAPCTGRRFSKRLKLSEGRDALIWRAKKDPATRQLWDVVLLDEEEVQPKDPIRYASDERKGAKMYYPSRDHPEAVELFYSDMKCLEPEQYISSPILDFYIRYLQRSLSYVYKNKGEYYFFNTYFFGKLEQALSSKGDRSLQFSKLRRWWKGINIFEKAYIFLPIHKEYQNIHLLCFCVCLCGGVRGLLMNIWYLGDCTMWKTHLQVGMGDLIRKVFGKSKTGIVTEIVNKKILQELFTKINNVKDFFWQVISDGEISAPETSCSLTSLLILKNCRSIIFLWIALDLNLILNILKFKF